MMFALTLLIILAALALGAGLVILHFAIVRRAVLLYLSALTLISAAASPAVYWHYRSSPPAFLTKGSAANPSPSAAAGDSGFGPEKKGGAACGVNKCGSRGQVDDVTRLLRQFNLERAAKPF